MPRRNYIPVRLRVIGRGKHMDQVVLKKALLFALTHRPCEVEREMGFKHGTAIRLCKKARALKLTKEQAAVMTPQQLSGLYYARQQSKSKHEEARMVRPDLALLQENRIRAQPQSSLSRERKLALNYQLIVDLYYLQLPANLELVKQGYSLLSTGQVLRLWREYRKTQVSAVYRVRHEYGVEAEYDFCGVKLRYYDGMTPRDATILVGVLPASGYFYVTALKDQSLAPVCDAVADSFRFWGGCPQVLRVDNFKAAVSKASHVGGEVYPNFAALARYFNCEIFTCRSRTPTDKACVEATVKAVTRYALALTQHYLNTGGKFNSLKELNEYLRPLCDKLLQRPIRGLNKSRTELFEECERPCLRQPAAWDYRFTDTLSLKVPPNGRITFKEHDYALPESLIGQSVNVEATAASITFTHANVPITTYPRRDGPGLSTQENYIRKPYLIYDIFAINHQDSLLLQWALRIGPDVVAWCREALNKKGRYADIVRRIHAVLSLPKGYCNLYLQLNLLIKELRGRSLNDNKISSGLIYDKWQQQRRRYDGAQDKCCNAEIYFECGKAVLTGKAAVMAWPGLSHALNATAASGNERTVAGEYLHSVAMYRKRYAALFASLNSTQE